MSGGEVVGMWLGLGGESRRCRAKLPGQDSLPQHRLGSARESVFQQSLNKDSLKQTVLTTRPDNTLNTA